MPTKLKIPKTKSYPQLKKLLDKHFSLFIRQRGSKENYNRCFTCGAWKEIKDLHCGHYVSRTYIGTRWDETNCWPQCPSCNLFHEGMKDEFARMLIAKFGNNILDILAYKKKNSPKFTAKELEILIQVYKEKLKTL